MIRRLFINNLGTNDEKVEHSIQVLDDAKIIPSLLTYSRKEIAMEENMAVLNHKETLDKSGYNFFKLRLTAEKRFIEWALNAGLGMYSAQGMESLDVVEEKNTETKNQMR